MAQHLTASHALAEPEAAVYIGYTQSALRAWRRLGRGPAYVRHARSVRYLACDLDAWLAAHRVETRDSRNPEAA
jgi:hypothetical protein